MRLIFLAILIVTSTWADDRQVLERVPVDYDYILTFRVAELMGNKKLMEKVSGNAQFKKAEKTLNEKLGLEKEDLISFSIAGIAAEYQRNRPFQKMDLDSAVYIKLSKPLVVDNLKQEFRSSFSGSKQVNGFECIQFSYLQMKNAYLVFLSPTLLMLCPDKNLLSLLSVQPETSMLSASQAERLLRTNGFGGVMSFVHWGAIGEVHPMTPWLKDYTGGSLNIYYQDDSALEMELTMSFNELNSVKSASLMVGMGMSFLDLKPELSYLKKAIDFKVYNKSLLVDVKVTPSMLNELVKTFSKMGRRQ